MELYKIEPSHNRLSTLKDHSGFAQVEFQLSPKAERYKKPIKKTTASTVHCIGFIKLYQIEI